MAISVGAESSGAPVDIQAYAMQIQQKYQEERNKRFRPDGVTQYIEPSKDGKFRNFLDDPWVKQEKTYSQEAVDGSYSKFLIVGAGFGGLSFAARLIQNGISPSDIRFVDYAGGFGGTWYWNRYPGLMCDIESYIYVPLLEETGYVPTRRYSSGAELLDYANLIADKFELSRNGIFSRRVDSITWDDEKKEWQVHTTASGGDAPDATLRAQYVFMCTGLLVAPKLPGVPGLDSFNGKIFHTSRFDYNVTGGSPKDPTLTKLQDKNVGILGTGATGVQVVPILAKYAKHLYVFQRTPSSVNRRDNKATDPEEFNKSIANHAGWWQERNANYASFHVQTTPLPETNLVNDEWGNNPAYCALVGGDREVKPEDIPAYVGEMYQRDFAYAEKVRARVAQTVKDPETAEKLKHWYPIWCKRPCFHDEYLPAFNEPNVELVHTDGKSISEITPAGVVVSGKEYPVDVLILATGYESPSKYMDGATRASIKVTGRGGIDLSGKLRGNGDTLHGVITHDFPNLFLAGPGQMGQAANNAYTLDVLARHVAYIVSEAEKKGAGKRITVEPSVEAETNWGYQIASHAANGAAMIGCTPSYLNAEGALDMVAQLPPEEQFKQAKKGIWGRGILDYEKTIKQWRDEGSLQGLEVNAY